MQPTDTLYILSDTHPREGEFLSIFTDIEEAKWFCEVWLKNHCREVVSLEWREVEKGVFNTESKYQTYQIKTMTRKEFEDQFNEYTY